MPFVPRPHLLYVLCPFLAALLPLFIPIARNFEYEYATLAAYAALILFGAAALLLRPQDGPKTPLPWLGLSALGAAFSALPAVIAFRSQLCLCGERDFWLWWILQFGPHLLWGQLGFLAIATWRRQGRSKVFCATLVLSALVALLLHLGAVLWFQPQKRITHLLAGFIHGAIYDNWIPLDPGILFARGGHALFALALACVLFLRSRAARILVLPLSAAALFCTYRSAPYPSQSHGLKALEELMPLTRKGDRFILHYSDMRSRILSSRLDDLYEAASFHMRDLSQKLLVYDTTVHIFVYPSREDKKLWFGGDGTDITDVYTPSVHINLESWPHGTLRHELVHALASSFAFHGLGFHPNLAFTEGLAVALAPEEDEISLHEGAASLLNSGRILKADSLFSPLFWSQSGRRAYTVAGSIIVFLLDRYGINKVKDLYAGRSWREVFGRDAETILGEWKGYLMKAYPVANEAITTEALFRYPGILHDVCPHSKALLIKSSEDPMITRRQPRDWDPDKHYWDWRMSISEEDDPETMLAALRSRANELWRDFDPKAADALLAEVERHRRQPPRVIEDLEMLILKVDLLIALDQFREARQTLDDYLIVLSSFGVSDSLQRQLWARVLLLREPAAAARPWLRLMSGIDRNVPVWDESYRKSWVMRYLFLRNFTFTGQHEQLLKELSRERPPRGVPGTFGVEWQKTVGLQWMRLQKYAAAEEAFLQAAALAPDAKRDAISLYSLEARDRGKAAH